MKTVPSRYLLPLFALPLLFFSCFDSDNQGSSVSDATLQTTLENLQNEMDLQGLSVAVIWPDGREWTGAAGVSHQDNAVQTNMLFGIGSITKHYMGTLMLLLQEEGLISMDASIDAWLSISDPNIENGITIRQLLNHTSGIFNYTDNPQFGEDLFQSTERTWAQLDLLNYVEEPLFEPGESWSYSNSNYILLGMIAEKATNSTLTDLFNTYIFQPLNFTNSYFPDQDFTVDNMAHPWSAYQVNTPQDALHWYGNNLYSAAWASGAILATSLEVARYFNAVHRGGLLSDESIASMTEFVPINSINHPSAGGYGLGSTQFLTLREYWGHGGDIFGYGAIAGYIPQDGISISILCNQDLSADGKVAVFRAFIEVLSSNQ